MSPKMAHSQPLRNARSIWRVVKATVDLSSVEACLLVVNQGVMAEAGPYVPTILRVWSSSRGAQAATARPYSSFSGRVESAKAGAADAYYNARRVGVRVRGANPGRAIMRYDHVPFFEEEVFD